MVSGSAHAEHVLHPDRHRHSADVLLPSVGAAGLCGHEGPAVCGGVRRVSAQPASLVGPCNGVSGIRAYVQGFLSRGLSSATAIQLGDRSISADLTLLLSYTGYLLPWDQLAFWAVTVGSNIAKAVPLMGKQIRFLMLGGNEVNANALLRFYVLHCVILPLVAILLVGVHFWRIRKDGGLYVPEKKNYDRRTDALK